MDRDPRERERGAPRSDLSSLWIDFLLLPQKLEEHLAAGPTAIPSPPELISMFLEQAITNHKSGLANSSSANIAAKDAEPQRAVKTTNRTVALLCERAARVAVVMGHTLSDIEKFIASPLHQFILLKALIVHDKRRSLLHQCDLHRWLIHRALHTHPVGSASPNVVIPANRLGLWMSGDDLGEVFHGVVNGSGDPSSLLRAGDPRFEEERPSVEFLENVLRDDSAVNHKDTANFQKEPNLEKAVVNGGPNTQLANGGSNTQQALSAAYKSQVILDVAEVYFMRGRVRRAHELFTKCGEMLGFLSDVEHVSEGKDKEDLRSVTNDAISQGSLSNKSPVPQDKLAGYLVACKMLLGTSADVMGSDVQAPVLSKVIRDPYWVGAPSPAQWAVVACEQNRWAARKYGATATSQSPLANGDSSGSDFSSGKENVGASVSGRTSTDTIGHSHGLEDNSSYQVSSRSKKRLWVEEANGHVTHEEAQLDKDENATDESFGQVNESRNKEAGVDNTRAEESPSSMNRDNGVDALANGGDPRSHGKKGLEEGNWDRKSGDDGRDVKVLALADKPFRLGVGTVKNERTTSVNGSFGAEVELLLDLKSDPGDDVSGVDTDMKSTPSTKHERGLVQAFVEDILRGHLSRAYCLAIEKDSFLSKHVRSKLAACNVVRSVLEGAPVESFLRTRGHFDDNEEAIDFFMQLLLGIKVMPEGSRLSELRSSGAIGSMQEKRLAKLGFFTQSSSGLDVSVVSLRVEDLAMYVCCVIDKPWCWASASKFGLVDQSDVPRFPGHLPRNSLRNVEGSGIFPKASTQKESVQKDFSVPRQEDLKLPSEAEILLHFVQVETIHELEGLVGTVKKILRRNQPQKDSAAVGDGLHGLAHAKRKCEHDKSPVVSDLVKPVDDQPQGVPNSSLASSEVQRCTQCESGNGGFDSSQCSSLEADVATILKRRALNALETMNDVSVAKRLYELVDTFRPRDCDSAMMLWLLESAETDGCVASQKMRDIARDFGGNVLPNLGLLDFAILHLIEKEQWGTLCELCKWMVSLILPESAGRDGEPGKIAEKDGVVGRAGFGGTGILRGMKKAPGWQFRQRRLLQTLDIARTIVDLIPLCFSLPAAVSRNHFSEDVARLGSSLSQLFEEFLYFMIGIESDDHQRKAGGDDDLPHSKNASVHSASTGLIFISRVSNSRVLMALASLTAGWLQRCHVVGLTRWPLAVERYGVLAGVTAGASLPPPSITYSASVIRPVPPKASPEFGRHLFGVLLEGIVGLPGVIEGDIQKGHRWLQGLADLAFEDELYVKALRLYLQAGACRSAQYCDRASSMNRDIFTPWVIQRMVAACRAIGAAVQAAVLCQCLPVPDHEAAFRILQEDTLIMDRDAAAYFECVWEVPILELLVHLHSRAGDEARVATLIGLLQQPALNVHNPPAIRAAHISTMEQRFLQRFAGELL